MRRRVRRMKRRRRRIQRSKRRMKISWSTVTTDGGQEEARHDALAHFSEMEDKMRTMRREEEEEEKNKDNEKEKDVEEEEEKEKETRICMRTSRR